VLTHLFIPSGVESEAIIGQNQRPRLRFGEMIEHDDRNFGHLELPGGENARVASDDHAVRAHQDLVRPPELDDAGRDLRDLLLRMRPRVADVGKQLVDRPKLDEKIAKSLDNRVFSPAMAVTSQSPS